MPFQRRLESRSDLEKHAGTSFIAGSLGTLDRHIRDRGRNKCTPLKSAEEVSQSVTEQVYSSQPREV